MFDYGEFCPISMATTTLCERWTLQIIREMVLGATRYSQFQRHMPKISPTLLKNRLRFLEEEGIVLRKKIKGGRGHEYFLTPKGKAVEPILSALGKWGMTWMHDGISDEELNVYTLMRDISAAIDLDELPGGNTVIQIIFSDQPDLPPQIIQIEDNASQYCDMSLGHDVDVYITGSLLALTKVWYGDALLSKAIEDGDVKVIGDAAYTSNITKWLRISGYSEVNPLYKAAKGEPSPRQETEN